MGTEWYQVGNVEEIPSPALLIYPDRIQENIWHTVALAGKAEHLRPHVKTHKMAEIVRLHLEADITKFKCATIAEAEMLANCGAPDVLLGYQPTGPNVNRLLQLVRHFPKTKFSAIADDEGALRVLSRAFTEAQLTLEVLLDIDCGMHRCGVEPGLEAIRLYRLLGELSGLKAGGLHVYDGHNHAAELYVRRAQCDAYMAPVRGLQAELIKQGLPVPKMVVGGTPTFALHAQTPDVECSPGTTVLWDAGYGNKFQDLDFLVAAVLLTRVISKPGPNRLCLDLGHKAVAAENPPPRVYFLGLPEAKAVSQSEEHLVIETERAQEFKVGDCLYGIPHHICPTVALHSHAVVVENGYACGRWKIVARDRQLTI